MKTAILVGAGALIAWIATWSFRPEPTPPPAPAAPAPALAQRAERVAPPPRLAATAPAAPDTPVARSPEQLLASLEAARDDGHWTAGDRDQLRVALGTLPADQANEFMLSIARAVNAGKLELDAPIL